MPERRITATLELKIESGQYGDVLNDLLDQFQHELLFYSIDFRLPSSASSPRITVTIADEIGNRTELARYFACTVDELEWTKSE